MDRRDFLKAASLTSASIAGLPLFTASARGQAIYRNSKFEPPIAQTKYGKVRGASQNGVICFKGIPYAGSPTGANRFKPPVKPEPWDGVRDALLYGAASIQPLDPNRSPTAVLAPANEHCEYLNVWTPMIRDGGKRPVMFYSHGGGFTTGNGGAEGTPDNLFHDGAALAGNYDVIVVTHNHRLGLFGYLYLGEVLGEEYAASGSNGMLDIVAALEWVRDNIEEFGGDPDCVMIFGESGGGAKTSCLTAFPTAQGMFHRASVESGSLIRGLAKDRAAEMTHLVLENLGLKTSEARQLLTLPTERLLKAQMDVTSASAEALRRTSRLDGNLGFSPVIDGTYLPSGPYDPTAPAISAHVPQIVGTNENEANFMYMHQADVFRLDNRGLEKRVNDMLGEKSGKVLEVYRRTRPNASPTDLFLAIATARMFWANAIKMAERKVQLNGAPVYMYRFTYESDVLANDDPPYPMRASHAMEIPFKFDHPQLPMLIGKNPDRFLTAYNMSRAWATFARTGKPSFEGIPEWPAYTLDKRETMFINAKCRVVSDPNREERLVWGEI
jgi:para-nitrobenzyl esterase